MTASASILMGSKSDLEVMSEATKVLREFNVPCEVRVISAHRTFDRTHEFGRSAKERGVNVILAGAGKAAHLAGVMASLTTLPVIGVPMATSDLGGLDLLLSTVQMPGGIPVASTAIGKARTPNADLLAVSILALTDQELASQLQAYQEKMCRQVEHADSEVQGMTNEA